MQTGSYRLSKFIFAILIVLASLTISAFGANSIGGPLIVLDRSVTELLIVAAIGVFGAGLFNFSWKKKSDESTIGQKRDIDSKPIERQRRYDRKATEKHNKESLARTASDTSANFSKSYASSEDISHLPITKINGISEPSLFETLPESDDPDLLDAIDQLSEDDEADSDAEIRMLAIRILNRFKTSNSVAALSQVALYDLSATLRSKAVAILSEFDHESVFDTIILACADPSREVRAAGARAMVKLTFDRGDAWSRAAHSKDVLFSRQVARAAVESGIAERSFDRLVMRDEKAAYEAFALVYLLIRTGETEKIFDAIRSHNDIKTRLALLHSIKAANIAEIIPDLSKFISDEPMTSQVADKAREALLGITAVPVSS